MLLPPDSHSLACPWEVQEAQMGMDSVKRRGHAHFTGMMLLDRLAFLRGITVCWDRAVRA